MLAVCLLSTFASAEQYSALLRLSSKDYTIRERLDKVYAYAKLFLCRVVVGNFSFRLKDSRVTLHFFHKNLVERFYSPRKSRSMCRNRRSEGILEP